MDEKNLIKFNKNIEKEYEKSLIILEQSINDIQEKRNKLYKKMKPLYNKIITKDKYIKSLVSNKTFENYIKFKQEDKKLFDRIICLATAIKDTEDLNSRSPRDAYWTQPTARMKKEYNSLKEKQKEFWKKFLSSYCWEKINKIERHYYELESDRNSWIYPEELQILEKQEDELYKKQRKQRDEMNNLAANCFIKYINEKYKNKVLKDLYRKDELLLCELMPLYIYARTDDDIDNYEFDDHYNDKGEFPIFIKYSSEYQEREETLTVSMSDDVVKTLEEVVETYESIKDSLELEPEDD